MATWFQRATVLCTSVLLVSACATYQSVPLSSSNPPALRSKLHRGQLVRAELEGGNTIEARIEKLGEAAFVLASREIPYASVIAIESRRIDYPETAKNALLATAVAAVYLLLLHLESEACDDYTGPDACYQ